MTGRKNRLQQFEGALRALLDASRSSSARHPRFPAREPSSRRSLVAVELSGAQPSDQTSSFLARGSLFGAGGSISKGRIRHFNDRDFATVPMPGFAPVGDSRRLALSRRSRLSVPSSRWRNFLDVLLRR